MSVGCQDLKILEECCAENDCTTDCEHAVWISETEKHSEYRKNHEVFDCRKCAHVRIAQPWCQLEVDCIGQPRPAQRPISYDADENQGADGQVSLHEMLMVSLCE